MPCTMHNFSPFEITQVFNHIGERRHWPATLPLRTGRTIRLLLLDAMHVMRPPAKNLKKKNLLEGSTTGMHSLHAHTNYLCATRLSGRHHSLHIWHFALQNFRRTLRKMKTKKKKKKKFCFRCLFVPFCFFGHHPNARWTRLKTPPRAGPPMSAPSW